MGKDALVWSLGHLQELACLQDQGRVRACRSTVCSLAALQRFTPYTGYAAAELLKLSQQVQGKHASMSLLRTLHGCTAQPSHMQLV